MRTFKATGFTLIELMVCVTVIGVLASVAIPAYQDYTAKAQLAEAYVVFDLGRKGVGEYYARWGKLPSNNADAGLYAPDAYRGRFVETMDVKNGSIRVVLTKGAINSKLKGKAVYFRPKIDEGGAFAMLSWSCRADDKELTKEFVVPNETMMPMVGDELLQRSCRT